ncbi:MAG TPA: TerC family protein [Bryobacteraceae bacterium]|nr:TerC family protein [Bryobacteraceae bacterium]
MFDWLADPNAWVALLTLTSLEIVLGIDNIIFIAILAGRLPAAQQARARFVGLMVALVSRLLLLLSIAWITRLTAPLFSVFGHGISGRDLVLILGGLFLLAKSTHEIHSRLEGEEDKAHGKAAPTMFSVVAQIMVLDIVFSLDSVITAVGMVDEIPVMMTAVIIAVAVMLIASGSISSFVDRHPTIKMLALSFLILVGTTLVAEGFGQHIPKGYVYFAMAFSVGVEMLNLKAGGRAQPVHLRQAISKSPNV